jgi:hypothetical protein
MPVETERRSSTVLETGLAAEVTSRAASSAPAPAAGLDWRAFSAAFFPERRRHDLEAVAAYAVYRRSHPGAALSTDGGAALSPHGP